MIDLGSIAGLHAHDHQLHAYCARCDRWVMLDLAGMIRSGHGERRLPLRVKCGECGATGQVQVRPPMPAWTNSNGWIQVDAHSSAAPRPPRVP